MLSNLAASQAAATAARLEQMGHKKEILGFKKPSAYSRTMSTSFCRIDACMAEVRK